MPVREFAQAYKHSRAGEDQARALKQDFTPCGNADSALAWTKHALTGQFPLPPSQGIVSRKAWALSKPVEHVHMTRLPD